MLGKDPFGDPYHSSDARIEQAANPEPVVLSGLLGSHYWRDHPQPSAEAARRLNTAPHQPPLHEKVADTIGEGR
ncbi:hypothetical protein [Streptomyces sp. MBT27]|uniref:hypothetical protein n=1 Tax=Streptomyces sp. MBT27 TaxID=1488356 RepID=UPI0014226FFC|nr:hypothetical protein [Streptomyces sp. MBT27]